MKVLQGLAYRVGENPTWLHMEGASLVKTLSKTFLDGAPPMLFGLIMDIVLSWSEEMGSDEMAYFCRGVADLILILLR